MHSTIQQTPFFFDCRATEKTSAAAKTKKAPETKSEVKAKPEVKDARADPTLALFADSTDEDEPVKGSAAAMETDDEAESELPDLPDFFAEKHFFFFGDFAAPERRLLTRYIAAYDG